MLKTLLLQNIQSCLLCHQMAQTCLCSGCLNDLTAVFARPNRQIITPDAVWSHEWHSADYAPPLPAALHAWKHNGKTAFSKLFQYIMLNNPPVWINRVRIDAVLAMPISNTRRLARGFNQCDELADAVGERHQIAVLSHRSVFRQHKAAQSSLNKHQRIENIKNSFEIQTDLSGQTILLIDDICTTGATLHELANAVKKAGAKDVLVWVVARKSALQAA